MIGALTVAVWLVVCPSNARSGAIDPQQVKAAFLVNFLKFVIWPDTAAVPDAPIVVAVFSADNFAAVLEREAAGQSIAGRTITVRVVHAVRELREPPQSLFIGASEQRNLPAVLRELEGKAVLTVGDGDGFGAAGVVLNFYASDKRIRFEANTTAASRAGLKISAHLLRLARIVG